MDFAGNDGLALLNQYAKNEPMLSHCYAAEAFMGAVA
jgi:predicted hydrolase (HD superfamily)